MRAVRQLPKASSTGELWCNLSASCAPVAAEALAAECVRKRRIILAVSVLPAPLSPLIMIWCNAGGRRDPQACVLSEK